MSRTDQYIGLTSEANKFVSTLKREGHYCLEGAWNEMTYGVWSDDRYVYIEVVQCSPWSSGPMYFTRLLKIPHRLHPLDGTDRITTYSHWHFLFSWVNAYESVGHIDFHDRQEYDQLKGEIYL